jgi:hypothetical protein
LYLSFLNYRVPNLLIAKKWNPNSFVAYLFCSCQIYISDPQVEVDSLGSHTIEGEDWLYSADSDSAQIRSFDRAVEQDIIGLGENYNEGMNCYAYGLFIASFSLMLFLLLFILIVKNIIFLFYKSFLYVLQVCVQMY